MAEHALLTRLRLFDAHEGWGRSGAISCAQWLSWRTGIGPKAAREKVRVARALGGLAKVDALFARGELSYSKVRAITRVATPESEQDFIDIAVHATASQIERLARAYRRVHTEQDDPAAPPLDRRRFMRKSETWSGMVRIEIQLPPEEAAVVWNAVTSVEAELAEPAVAATEASAEASSAPNVDDGGRLEERRADAIVDVARAYLQHRPRTLGSGYELVVITSSPLLEQGANGIGGFLPEGTPVPLHVARMLACDGARVDVVMGKDGELLDVGRPTRAIPSAIARALWLRDGGCRVPGCGRRRHLHAHHIQGWADGGPTKLSNLVLVCSSHHRMIHEGQLSSEIRDGRIVFVDGAGRSMLNVPPSVARGCELEELEIYLRDADVHVDGQTAQGKWDGTQVAVAEMLDWVLMAQRAGVDAFAGR